MDADADAAAGALQRSEISFRRTGSSGLVWDDKFLGELAKIKPASSQDPVTTTTAAAAADDADPPRSSSDAAPILLQRSRSHAGGGEPTEKQAGYKATKVPFPSIDPPSPKVSGCGALCGIFGDGKQNQKQTKRGKVVGTRRV